MLALNFLAQGLAHAQTVKDPRWTVSGGLKLRYVDNAFAFSDERRDRFKSNPDLFPVVESLDDFVWVPSVGLAYRARRGKFAPTVSLGLRGDFYVSNPKRSFETLGASFRHGLPAGVRISAGYTLIPRFFLGERLISNTSTDTQTMSFHQFSLALDRDFTASLNGWVQGAYTIWDFNDSFSALDTDTLRGGLGLTYKYKRYATLGMGYYVDRAFGESGIISGTARDTSFIRHTGFMSSTILPFSNAALRLNYAFRHTRFTADLSQDPDNFGHRAGNHSGSIALLYKATSKTTLNLIYDRVINRTNRNFSNYTQNRYLFGMSYRLN
jgi:hypothetical protein